MNNLRNKSGVYYGVFCKTIDPQFIEVIGKSGFDFVILDREHGYTSFETLSNLVRAAQISNLISIVRTESNLETEISKVLDMGADGVQVPKVTNLKEAINIIEAAKFYPYGNRGVCRYVRSADYSIKEKNLYFEEANKNSLVILQLEGKEVITDLDNILSLDHIDVLFIGPYDLSQSLGLPGEVSHPTVINFMKNIVKKCTAKGVMVGVFVDNVETANYWVDFGVRYIAYSVDVGIFSSALLEIKNKFKGKK